MPLLKKIHDSWQPAEKRDLQLGEVIDFPGDVEVLVKSGMAMIVDEAGNELELPNQKFTCPICFNDATGLMGFVEHVTGHSPKPKKSTIEGTEPMPEAETVTREEVVAQIPNERGSAEPENGLTKEELLKAKRLAALEKARAARKAKSV